MILLRTLCAAFLTVAVSSANAQTIRVASFNVELDRDGPGLLLRDLERGTDPKISAIVGVISTVAPDILALQGFDWDHDGAALAALVKLLKAAGTDYGYRYATQPNSGMATDLDLDGDGRAGGPGDSQGFGSFTGQNGIAVLSRFPVDTGNVQDLSGILWRDLPGALLPEDAAGNPFPSVEALNLQRLSSTAHWIVPIVLPNGKTLSLLTFHASPPVFDGEEDRNGKRNHDEIIIWRAVLDGQVGNAPAGLFVLAGDANLDPFDSDGRSEAIRSLLKDPRFQDPTPRSDGAGSAPDQSHVGDDALDTADWPAPGRLRVDYVLPSQDWRVTGASVYWPAEGMPGHDQALAASRHRLVWVDLALD